MDRHRSSLACDWHRIQKCQRIPNTHLLDPPRRPIQFAIPQKRQRMVNDIEMAAAARTARIVGGVILQARWWRPSKPDFSEVTISPQYAGKRLRPDAWL